MTKKKAAEDLQKKGRKLLYGEETVLFARKVPKSKEGKVSKTVDGMLKQWEVNPPPPKKKPAPPKKKTGEVKNAKTKKK